jgi:hypothetical protein
MIAVAEMTLADRLAAIKAAGFWTPEEAARFDALRNASYVLVRIDGVGERWRCNRCNGRHTHFTLMCVERPFRGLLDGLHAYWANVGDAGTGNLSPAQQRRLDVLTPIFGGRPLPLGTAHPRMAADLATDERDVLIGSTVLGSLDPIPPAKARLLVEIINMRARRTVLTL